MKTLGVDGNRHAYRSDVERLRLDGSARAVVPLTTLHKLFFEVLVLLRLPQFAVGRTILNGSCKLAWGFSRGWWEGGEGSEGQGCQDPTPSNHKHTRNLVLRRTSPNSCDWLSLLRKRDFTTKRAVCDNFSGNTDVGRDTIRDANRVDR